MPIFDTSNFSSMVDSAPDVIWDKEIDVPEKWIQFVDDNVVASTFIPCHLRASRIRYDN